MSTKKIEALGQLLLLDSKNRKHDLTNEEMEIQRGVVEILKNRQRWGKSLSGKSQERWG